MHAQKNWFKVALMTLAVFGLTTGAFTLAAQTDDNKDERKFDHYACYEVEERDDKDDDDKKDHYKDDDDKDNDEEVILFNQFEGGTKVRVGELELLCVPTHKEHRKDDGHKDDKK